jgi:hypothetical protein
MSDKLSGEVRTFKMDLEAKLRNGLTDMKFFAREVSEATVESFVEQVNAVERKVQNNEYEVLDWQNGHGILNRC